MSLCLYFSLHSVPLHSSQTGNEQQLQHPPLKNTFLCLFFLLILTNLLFSLSPLQLDKLPRDIDKIIHLRFHRQNLLLTNTLNPPKWPTALSHEMSVCLVTHQNLPNEAH